MMHIAKSMMLPNKAAAQCYVVAFFFSWLPHTEFAKFSNMIKLSALILTPDKMNTNRTTVQCISLEQEGRGTHELQLDQATMEHLHHLFQVSHSVM